MQLLCTVSEKINVIRFAADELRKVQACAPPNVTGKGLIVEAVAMTRDIAESGLGAHGTVMLEKLRLYCKTGSQLAVVHAIADVAEHHVVRVGHFVDQSSQPPYSTARFPILPGIMT